MENELELTLGWENGVGFECKANNNGETVAIIEMGENGDIASLWSYVQEMLVKYFTTQLTNIGADMAG